MEFRHFTGNFFWVERMLLDSGKWNELRERSLGIACPGQRSASMMAAFFVGSANLTISHVNLTFSFTN